METKNNITEGAKGSLGNGVAVSQSTTWKIIVQKVNDVLKGNSSIPMINMDMKSLVNELFNSYHFDLGYGNSNEGKRSFENDLWKKVYFPEEKRPLKNIVLGGGYYIQEKEDGMFYLYKSGELSYIDRFYQNDYEVINKNGKNILVFNTEDKTVALNPYGDLKVFRSAIKHDDIEGTVFVAIKDVWRNTLFLNTETMKSSRAFHVSGYKPSKDGKTLLLKRRWFHFWRPYFLLDEHGKCSRCFYDYTYGGSKFLLCNRISFFDTFYAHST